MRSCLKLHREKIHKAFSNGIREKTNLLNDNRKHEGNEFNWTTEKGNIITNHWIRERVSLIPKN